jgi:hypothetical protein
VLARSFKQQHPNAPFFVLLVDQVDEGFTCTDDLFELVRLEELPIPDLRAFLFRYTVLEANTATKPFFLAHLLATRGLETIVYIDPDIQIFAPLDLVRDRLGRYDVVLTPHLDGPLNDDKRLGEKDILLAGAYNLGFLALRASQTTDQLLEWWRERLLYLCLVRIEDGLFVDQRWMDLVPGLFESVHILRDPGHNAAYWNLHCREIRRTAAGWEANGRLLVFFHFSGFDPANPRIVSRHQNRFAITDIGPDLPTLFRDYARTVLDAGHAEYRNREWAFNRFSDGLPIPEIVRSIFREGETRWTAEVVADPRRNFAAVLVEPTGGRGSSTPRLLIHDLLYVAWKEGRLDPRSGFGSRHQFFAWLRDVGRHQLKLPPELLGDIDGLTGREHSAAASLWYQFLGGVGQLRVRLRLGERQRQSTARLKYFKSLFRSNSRK